MNEHREREREQSLEGAKSYYVFRRNLETGREGWTGSLRPLSRAEKEATAWRLSSWTAEIWGNTPAVRARVRAWQQAALAAR